MRGMQHVLSACRLGIQSHTSGAAPGRIHDVPELLGRLLLLPSLRSGDSQGGCPYLGEAVPKMGMFSCHRQSTEDREHLLV